jgi:hypothetical protein
MSTGPNNFFRAESTMTNQPKDTSKPVDQSDKKKSETVQLTAEDLRAISGGTSTHKPLPVVSTAAEKVITKKI